MQNACNNSNISMLLNSKDAKESFRLRKTSNKKTHVSYELFFIELLLNVTCINDMNLVFISYYNYSY